MIPRVAGRVFRSPFSTAIARVRRKHKVAIVLGFYGGNYSGMQCNDLKTSVEDILIHHLYSMGKISFSNAYKPSKFDWERCSRTDKGVSAIRIVVTGKMEDYDDEFSDGIRSPLAVDRLNHLLPDDIRVFSYTRVSNRFNPHLFTFARQYSYFLPVSRLKQLGVSLDRSLFEQSLKELTGTHYLKNYSGSVRNRNKHLRQFYVRTVNSITLQTRVVNEEEFWHISLNGNSFLYHQIRKMVGAAVATACHSWSMEYLRKSFNTENVAVPIAPSTPLVLQSVSFRSDKHTFLNKSELRSVVDKGRHKKNLNPNKSRDMILLMTDEEDRCSEQFFDSYTFPRIVRDIALDSKDFDTFIAHLHLGHTYFFIVCFPLFELTMEQRFGSRCNTEKVLQHLLQEGTLSKDNPCGLFISRDILTENLLEIKRAFPEPFFSHRYAVKANPIKQIIRIAKECGFGCECASIGEVYNALSAGMEISDVVYDSPLKLESDLRYCFQNGIHLNFDNLQEMEMGFEVYSSMMKEGSVTVAPIGIRINSQYGVGSIESTSTVSSTSKFGLPMKDTAFEDLLAMFSKWSALNCLHSHVGSQGIDLSMMVGGVKFVVDLADKINNRLGRKQITMIDIGGGLPVDYDHDEPNHIAFTYAEALHNQVPRLFSGDFTVLTEMGRAVVATSGWFATRVEYTKVAGGRLIGITHAGGNMFVREVYNRDIWHHPITIHDRTGKEKKDNLQNVDIAGPLCFSGDLIAKNVLLPAFEQGDLVVYHHTAAYSIGMYSKYNCIQAPPAYCYSCDPVSNSISVRLIKRKETIEEIMAFWDA